MGIREVINKNVGLVIPLVCVMVVAVGAWAIRETRTVMRRPVFPDKSFFTDDDGGTWFADDASNIPPYDHDGKEAVGAMVYTCDGGQHKWVQYLEKYNEQARQQMLLTATGAPLPENASGPMTGLMVKKPGDQNWIRESSAKGQQMIRPHCPDGMAGPAVLVTP